MMRHRLFAGAFMLFIAADAVRGESLASSEAMTEAATALLEALTPEQRDAAQFDFDAAERGTWSNLPTLMVPPPGVLLKDMTDAQRQATQALLRASLSSQGYAKFTGIMRLDDVLHEQGTQRLAAMTEEERSPLFTAVVANRNSNHYAVALFGEPGAERWGWKLAGHHAAANFTVSEGRVAFTPAFLGSSPRVIESGPYAGMMAMPKEGDRGLALMKSLSATQREKALLGEAFSPTIVAGPGRQNDVNAFEGLPSRELDVRQQRLLRVLVEEYVRNSEYDAADAQLAAIEASGWDALWFAWSGPVDDTQRFYYRVHGPRLLIEYHRVDANHDHSIVRDPVNDYGADWLGQHLEEHHPTREEIREAVGQRIGVTLPD